MNSEYRNYVIYVLIWLPTKAKKTMEFGMGWARTSAVYSLMPSNDTELVSAAKHIKTYFKSGHQRVKLCQHS